MKRCWDGSEAPELKKDRGDSKTERKKEMVEEAYELFVAYQELEEKAAKDEDEEEDLGSSDSDTDSDEEHSAATTIISWRDGCKKGLLGPWSLDSVKEMSRKIYDGTDEGFREIDDAASRAPSTSVDAPHGVKMVGMLVLRTEPPAEITQVFVIPTLRDSGIGKRLVRRALEYVSMELRCSQVDCFAICGSGPFYERFGFVEKNKADRANKKDHTPCADRAEMVMKIEPGTHYDVDTDDEDEDEEDEDEEEDEGEDEEDHDIGDDSDDDDSDDDDSEE